MSFLREDVMEAWFANAIDDSYLTDNELQECIHRLELLSMDLTITNCFQKNPSLTFDIQESETVH